MPRITIQNNDLPDAISTKLLKVKDSRLSELERIINILEYKEIPLENCNSTAQSVKIPNGASRLHLSKDTATRKIVSSQ